MPLIKKMACLSKAWLPVHELIRSRIPTHTVIVQLAALGDHYKQEIDREVNLVRSIVFKAAVHRVQSP